MNLRDDLAYEGISKETIDAICMYLFRLPMRHSPPEPGALIQASDYQSQIHNVLSQDIAP